MGSEEGQPALRLENVSFRYPGYESDCLRGIDLEVQWGEHVGIIGPSDAGKTTLCLCMAGVIPHMVEGELRGVTRVFGTPTSELTIGGLSERVGIIFDDPEAQLFSVTVEEELAFGPQNLGLERDEIMARIDEALEWTGTLKLRKASINTLSGGEKQRVAIAAVLAMRPPLLIMDEPTSMLDPSGTRQIFEVLDRLRSREQMTIVTVERKVERLAEFAERIYVLIGGAIGLCGDPADVFSKVDFLARNSMEPPQVTSLEHRVSSSENEQRAERRYSVTLSQAEDWLARTLEGSGARKVDAPMQEEEEKDVSPRS